MLLGGDESGGNARAATTTPGARTTRSRGSTGVDDASRTDRVPARADRASLFAPGLSAHEFFEGKGEQLPDVWCTRPDGRRMTRRDCDNTEVAHDRRFLNGRGVRARRREDGERCATTLSSCSSTRISRTSPSPASPLVRGALGGRADAMGRFEERSSYPGLGCAGRDALDRRVASCLSAALLSCGATYRLQPTPEFGFAEARELVPYLRDLGVSHLYLSPVAAGARGSQHGYDVIDLRRISRRPRRRGRVPRAPGAGLGVILDIVPNDMAAVDESPFWRDLELRQMFFDVDLRTGFHRRFFDVGELGGLQAGGREVFWATHAKVIELVREGGGRRPARRSSGRARRSGRVLRAARRRRRRACVGGEDPRAG